MFQDTLIYQRGAPRTVDDLDKLIVGKILEFVKHSTQEPYKAPFNAGDLLKVQHSNNGGFGIVVQRISDGVEDMVWDDEVRIP